MIWTWAGWEPQQFYRRLGGWHESQEGDALWSDDWRAMIDSEACAAALADAGINWITTHAYKGFGLASEAEELAALRRMIANHHRQGIRVFAYVQYGTVMPETIAADDPSSANWGRTDWHGQHDGHPYEYGDQYWRAKPCANQPGFREHLDRCVDAALDCGADGIWIDNLQADGCHCPRCQDAFRAHLRSDIADPWRELGLRDVSAVRIPRAERPRDPLFQSWVRFRCAETRVSLQRIAARTRARRPDALVAVNIGIGNHQRALIENANWYGDLACVDFTYAENHLFPRRDGDRLVSQRLPMGIAEAIGIRAVPGSGVAAQRAAYPRPAVPDAAALRRCFAESAMYGGHAFGGPFGLRGEDGGAPPILMRDAAYRRRHRSLVDWYLAHADVWQGSTEAAPVALLWSREAMLGDEPRSRAVAEAMAQLLMRNRIPFRWVLSDQLDRLDGVHLLVLAHVLPISDGQAAAIVEYVARGGRVLATGRSSLYDGSMRQRRDYALGRCFGVVFDRDREDASDRAVWRNPENGCVLLPGEWGVTVDGRTCGVDDAAVLTLIREAMSGCSLPGIACPVPHVAASWRRLADGRMALWLLNHADDPVEGITIDCSRAAQAWTCDGPVGVCTAAGTLRLPAVIAEVVVEFARS